MALSRFGTKLKVVFSLDPYFARPLALGAVISLAWIILGWVLKPNSVLRLRGRFFRGPLLFTRIIVIGALGFVLVKSSYTLTQSGAFSNDHNIDVQLNCPFEAEGGLFISRDTTSQPNFLELCQRRRFWSVEITSLSDLEGHVQIANSKQALSFVRLLTSLATLKTHISTNDLFEVMAREDITSEIEYGNLSTIYISNYSDGMLGLVSRDWMKVNGIPSATVVQRPEGWEIHRICIRRDSKGNWKPVAMIELVGRNGSYSKVEREVKIKSPSGGVGWQGADGDE